MGLIRWYRRSVTRTYTGEFDPPLWIQGVILILIFLAISIIDRIP